MKTFELRTSLFTFDPAELGLAYRVQVAPGYLDAWAVLQNEGKKNHPGLPTRALKEMLAILSGGPVEVNLYPHSDNGQSAILMLNPLSVDEINAVLHLWSLEVMRRWDAPTDGLEEKLKVLDVVTLLADDLVTPGNVSPLAYHTIPWRVAQAMSKRPMETRKPAKPGLPEGASRPIKLYQTSDNSLVTWDDPIVASNDFKSASALHVIEPWLVLLRDCKQPFIQLRVKLSQIMPNWIGKKKSAWVNTGNLIVLAGVESKLKEGTWQNAYAFPTGKLLAYLGHNPLPELHEGEIPFDSPFRPIHSVAPTYPLIAAGAGPVFLDQAGFHLRAMVKGCQPLMVSKAVSSLKTPVPNPITPSITVRIGVLAAHTETLIRLERAQESLISMPFFKRIAPPHINLIRVNAPNAALMLSGGADLQDLKQWLLISVIPALKQQDLSVAVVETSLEAASQDSDKDPKHFIRQVMAENGITTQFIMQLPTPENKKAPTREAKEKRDFKALNVVTEAIRLSGYFPALFAQTRDIPNGTTVLSVWLDRIQQKGNAIFLPVITRTVVGSAAAELFWFDPNRGHKGRWFAFTEGVAAIHATRTLLSQDTVRALISESLLVPTAMADTPLIVCLHSKLRQLYPGLQDSPRIGLPPIPDHAAVVRVRADDDVAQMTGNQSSHPDAPHFIGQKLGLFQSEQSPAVYYFVSPSKVYGSTGSLRYSTRYDADSDGLKDPWHQLGVTEITSIQSGTFKSATSAVEQVAQLCRNAPMWDGHLRLPSPMHLGAQIAGDHPILERQRKSEANRAAKE